MKIESVRKMGLLLLILPFTLWAQEEEPVVQSEITVTAEKREASLKDTPLSISVATEKFIEDTGADDITQVVEFFPNVFISGFNVKRVTAPFIRGIGSGQGDPAVTTYIDGVPQLFPDTTNIDLVGVERIEILRGPQGTLYGRNTIGGLVHYITGEPTNEWNFDLNARLGDYDYSRFAFTAEGPITKDRVYVSVSAAQTERDGFTENIFIPDANGSPTDVDNQDGLFARVQLMFTPNDSWKIKFIAQGQDDDDGGFVLYDLPSQRANPHQLLQDHPGFATRELSSYTLNATYRASAFDFNATISTGSWDITEQTDLDFGPGDFLRRATAEENDQTYAEFRFNSAEPVELGAATMQWVVGASFFDSSFEHNSGNEFRPDFFTLVGQDLPFSLFDNANYNLDDSGIGVFGNATFTFGENFDLIAGLRWVNEEKDTDLLLTSQLLPEPINVTDSEFSQDFDNVLPRVGLAYRFNDNVTGHFNAAKSYRAGGYNRNTTPSGPLGTEAIYQVVEETGWTYELGLKASLMEDRVYLATTLYTIDWEDRQLSIPNQLLPGRFLLDNVADSTSNGLELEVVAKVSEHWDIMTSLGLNDSEFDTYIDPNTGVDVDGLQLPTAPDTNWSFIVHGHDRLFDAYNGWIRGELIRFGEYFYDNLNEVGQSPYSIVNFRAGLERGGLRLEAFVRNSFATDYVPTAIPGSLGGYVGQDGQPRQVGASIGYKF